MWPCEMGFEMHWSANILECYHVMKYLAWSVDMLNVVYYITLYISIENLLDYGNFLLGLLVHFVFLFLLYFVLTSDF